MYLIASDPSNKKRSILGVCKGITELDQPRSTQQTKALLGVVPFLCEQGAGLFPCGTILSIHKLEGRCY